MNYVKKMCVLRQVRQGFSGDGKTLSGLVKVEQYGKNLAVEVSIINFAPLALGEYYCLLSDGKGKTETLALRGKSLFNIISDLNIANGFCAVVCYVKNEVSPIAYGINGNGSYDWRAILNKTMPPVFPQNSEEKTAIVSETEEEKASKFTQQSPPIRSDKENTENEYDDEKFAEENYYAEQTENEQIVSEKIENYAHFESGTEMQSEKERAYTTENGNAQSILHPFTTDGDGYYSSVKTEIDELMQKYPRDECLTQAFACSEWVRIKGDENNPQYLVGVIYDDGKAKYICYALATKNRNAPPEEIQNVCTFVPKNVYDENDGFFVIFQSASTGECIKPERA